jgi:hypothetical protein
VVLQELCCAIGDRTLSCNKTLEKSAFVKRVVIPLVSDSIVNITTALKILSPVSGIKCVHHCKECKKKQEILSTKSSILSPGEELIFQHVKDSQHNIQEDNGTPAPKQQRKSHECVNPTENRDSVKFPNPKSGKGYDKVDILNFMLNVPSDNGSL